jgi:hypothetical protein
VRVEALASDAESLSTQLREQVWCLWSEFNHGDRRLAGWGRWDTRPAPDLRQRAETLDKLGDALEKLGTAGVELEPVVEEFGLKLSADDAPEPATPETTTPADEDDEAA